MPSSSNLPESGKKKRGKILSNEARGRRGGSAARPKRIDIEGKKKRKPFPDGQEARVAEHIRKAGLGRVERLSSRRPTEKRGNRQIRFGRAGRKGKEQGFIYDAQKNLHGEKGKKKNSKAGEIRMGRGEGGLSTKSVGNRK